MGQIRAFLFIPSKGEFSMGMFVDPKAELEVSDDKGNVIVIKATMDFADSAKVEAALIQLKLKATSGKNRQVQVRPADGNQGEMEIDATVTYSMRQRAILEVCIKRWEGPDFTDDNGRPIPCTAKNIRLLNPNEPLIEKVLEVIDEQNTAPETAPLEGEPIDPNLSKPDSYGE